MANKNQEPTGSRVEGSYDPEALQTAVRKNADSQARIAMEYARRMTDSGEGLASIRWVIEKLRRLISSRRT